MILEKDVNGKDCVDGRELYKELGVKKDFTTWVNSAIKRANLIEGLDFSPKKGKSTGGRPSLEYQFTRDGAIAITMMSGGKFAGDIRKKLIELFNQRGNLELITVKESAFAFKVIQCLKYVENQKHALEMHKTAFVDNSNSKDYVYQRFNNFRNSIIGWDKNKVEEAIKEYQSKTGHKVKATSMTDKINVLDTPEAIRIACLDILYSKGEVDSAGKFSEMVKKLSIEMEIKSFAKNEDNFFQNKESVDVKLLIQ